MAWSHAGAIVATMADKGTLCQGAIGKQKREAMRFALTKTGEGSISVLIETAGPNPAASKSSIEARYRAAFVDSGPKAILQKQGDSLMAHWAAFARFFQNHGTSFGATSLALAKP
jgi:hypothetical protein